MSADRVLLRWALRCFVSSAAMFVAVVLPTLIVVMAK